jgi:polyphosphate:AMP phosphotransferase
VLKSAELGLTVGKAEYDRKLPTLRLDLLQAHWKIHQAGVPVVVVISGPEIAGKGELISRLAAWLDPRGLEVNAFGPPSDEERERPPWWRFWRALPPRGKIGIFLGSWYTMPILRRVDGDLGKSAFQRELDRITFFERMLAEDGAVFVKFWLHLSRKGQGRTLKRLEKDPRTRWRVTPVDWKAYRSWERFAKWSETALLRTDAPHAPWVVVDAADENHRDLAVARYLLEALRRGAEAMTERGGAGTTAGRAASVPAAGRIVPGAEGNVLDTVDTGRTVSVRTYHEEMRRLQGRVGALTRKAYAKKVSSVLVFEGWDAGGKGGTIRRLTEAIDPRLYRVVPIAAPTEEERAQHYLWRFWRHLPRDGRVTIFDRSWYGRVLVERVEGFAKPEEWERAYLEINDFEEQLAEHGAVVLKFWLHVTPEEQLRRFRERQRVGFKKHKLTGEDWRNRKKWAAYSEAVSDMVARTDTPSARWTLIAANDKKVARLSVLETHAAALSKRL